MIWFAVLQVDILTGHTSHIWRQKYGQCKCPPQGLMLCCKTDLVTCTDCSRGVHRSRFGSRRHFLTQDSFSMFFSESDEETSEVLSDAADIEDCIRFFGACKNVWPRSSDQQLDRVGECAKESESVQYFQAD